MNFSEFAQMMYPFIGKGQKTSDFIIDLTNQIMETPSTDYDKKQYREDKYNPLSSAGISKLEKIYNGARNLTKRDAQEIITHLNKEKFMDYLSNYPDDIIDSIGTALQQNGIQFYNAEILDTCAELFASILIESANGNKKLSPKNSHQENNFFNKIFFLMESERKKWDSHYEDSQK